MKAPAGIRLIPAARFPARRAPERAMEHSAPRRAMLGAEPKSSLDAVLSSGSSICSGRSADMARGALPRSNLVEATAFFEAAMTETDVVIIRAAPNRLTCAAYLAMAGLRVKV